MNRQLKAVLIAFAILLGIIFAILLVRYSIYLSVEQPAPGTEVGGVRVTAVECDIPKSIVSNPYVDFGNAQAVQIHYGYMKDGQWHDFPVERYKIASLLSGYGVDALDEDHVVQIGQYVLVCIFDNWPERKMIITDTAGTSVQTPLEEYHVDRNYLSGETSPTSYCSLYEDYSEFFEPIYPSIGVHSAVSRRQYLIVPLKLVDAEYTISYYYVDEDTGEASATRTITGLRILDKLGLLSSD